MFLVIYTKSHSVEDPGFSWWEVEGGANSQSRCANLLFLKFFAENCMKMKEFGPGEGASLDPSMTLQAKTKSEAEAKANFV